VFFYYNRFAQRLVAGELQRDLVGSGGKRSLERRGLGLRRAIDGDGRARGLRADLNANFVAAAAKYFLELAAEPGILLLRRLRRGKRLQRVGIGVALAVGYAHYVVDLSESLLVQHNGVGPRGQR